MELIFLDTFSTCLGGRGTGSSYERVRLRCLGSDLCRVAEAWRDGHRHKQYELERILFERVAGAVGIDCNPVALAGWLFDLVARIHDGNPVHPLDRQRAIRFVAELLYLNRALTEDLPRHSSVQ